MSRPAQRGSNRRPSPRVGRNSFFRSMSSRSSRPEHYLYDRTGWPALARTRILLVGMPQMLRDIIRDIVEKQPDMEVVGTASARDGALPKLHDGSVDAVVIGLPNSGPPEDFA